MPTVHGAGNILGVADFHRMEIESTQHSTARNVHVLSLPHVVSSGDDGGLDYLPSPLETVAMEKPYGKRGNSEEEIPMTPLSPRSDGQEHDGANKEGNESAQERQQDSAMHGS
jgi:hypothetical protein